MHNYAENFCLNSQKHVTNITTDLTTIALYHENSHHVHQWCEANKVFVFVWMMGHPSFTQIQILYWPHPYTDSLCSQSVCHTLRSSPPVSYSDIFLAVYTTAWVLKTSSTSGGYLYTEVSRECEPDVRLEDKLNTEWVQHWRNSSADKHL